MEFSRDAINLFRELRDSSSSKARRLRAEAEGVTQAEAFWSDLERFLDKGWAMHFLHWTDKGAPRLRALYEVDPLAERLVAEARKNANEHAERELRRYPAVLPEACAAVGLHLEGTSRHPKYLLEDGFFSLEIDEVRRMARLGDHEGQLAQLPADVEAVVEVLEREHERIFRRPHNGVSFLRRLRNQYKAILKRDHMNDGDPVPIRKITQRLGKNLKGFRTDEFLVDLSRLAKEGPYETDGRRVDLQQTKDTSQGMLLRGGGYVGFVLFTEA